MWYVILVLATFIHIIIYLTSPYLRGPSGWHHQYTGNFLILKEASLERENGRLGVDFNFCVFTFSSKKSPLVRLIIYYLENIIFRTEHFEIGRFNMNCYHVLSFNFGRMESHTSEAPCIYYRWNGELKRYIQTRCLKNMSQIIMLG